MDKVVTKGKDAMVFDVIFERLEKIESMQEKIEKRQNRQIEIAKSMIANMNDIEKRLGDLELL